MHKNDVRYRTRYREMKGGYEKLIGKQIADSTFSNFLRSYKSFCRDNKSLGYESDIMSKNFLKHLAKYLEEKTKLGKPPTNLNDAKFCVSLFKMFDKMQSQLTFNQFCQILDDRLKIKVQAFVHNSNFYRWFNILNLEFHKEQYEKDNDYLYKTEDLKYIAYRVGKWFVAKVSQSKLNSIGEKEND